MKSDIKNILNSYIKILENTDISNNMSGKDVSTKYTTDNTARFLPIGQDMDEEEKNIQKSQAIRQKLDSMFSRLKSLLETAEKPSSTGKDISNLLSFMDNPEVKGDLTELLNAIRLEEQNAGVNANISS